MAKKILIGILVIIFCFLFFSFKANDIGILFTGDESFYYQSAKGMLESGDYFIPRYYGKPRFQKPIFFYWLVALAFNIFGVNWFTARLPSILLASFVVFFVYLVAEELFSDWRLSLLSAFILATTFKFFKYARFAIPDMTLLFFVTISFYIILRFLLFDKDSMISKADINIFNLSVKRRFLWLSLFLLFALATLTKGPIGIIIPILTIIPFLSIYKQRLVIERIDILLGGILYLAVTLPWFLAMYKIYGDEFISHLWSREIVHRVGYYSETKHGINMFIEYLKTIFFYIPIVAVRFLPWSLFLPRGIINSISITKSFSAKKLGLFLCWFFTVFIFFSLIGEKHSQYMLLLTPPFAILVVAGFLPKGVVNQKRLIVPTIFLFLSVSFFLLFLTNKNLRLNPGIMNRFATQILAYGLEKTDKIAVGSHDLIPQHLEVYLDRPVQKVGGRWYDPSYNERTNKLELENFFKQNKAAFCIIRRDDYLRYISPFLKTRLNIIYKDYLWKRKINLTSQKFTLLLKGKLNSFIDSFREEYYLVTNK